MLLVDPVREDLAGVDDADRVEQVLLHVSGVPLDELPVILGDRLDGDPVGLRDLAAGEDRRQGDLNHAEIQPRRVKCDLLRVTCNV